MIRVRRQPGMTAKTRLKRDRILVRGQADRVDESRNSPETLGAITGRVRGTWGLAAVLGAQAVAAGRIGLADLALRHAMKAEEQMVEALAQVRLGALDQGG